MKNNLIIVRVNSICRGLAIIALLLIMASIISQLIKYLTGHGSLHGLIQLFYVDCEMNVPTLFSTFLLLSAAFLLTIITVLKRMNHDSKAYLWAVLSFGFIYLAIDEAWTIHERLILPVQELFNNDRGIFLVAWIIPALAISLVLGLLFLRFIQRLPRNTRISFIIAGAFYLGGAIFSEVFSAIILPRFGLANEQNFLYSMAATLEEVLEMAGIIIFIRALLVYIIAECNAMICFRFQKEQSEIMKDYLNSE